MPQIPKTKRNRELVLRRKLNPRVYTFKVLSEITKRQDYDPMEAMTVYEMYERFRDRFDLPKDQEKWQELVNQFRDDFIHKTQDN